MPPPTPIPAGQPVLGGCACGAVRYQCNVPDATKVSVGICHCRQCQRQAGSYVLPLFQLPLSQFVVTKGVIKQYRSSAVANRGFCGGCGSPLTFQYDGVQHISVVVGSVDGGDGVLPAPRSACGSESISPWFELLHTLPSKHSDVVTFKARRGPRTLCRQGNAAHNGRADVLTRTPRV